MIEEGQELLARPADLGLERPRQVATACGDEDGGQLPVEASALGGQCRSRQAGDLPGEGEDRIQPDLEAPGHRVVAGLDGVGDVARQMRQAGLVSCGMALLGRVAVREPERGAVSVHHVPDHRGRPGPEPGQNNFECGTPASVNSKFSCPLCAERAPAGGGRLLWITLSRASECAKYEITLDVALHFGSEGYSRTEKLNKSNDQVGRETLQLFKLSLGVLPPGALLRHQTRGMCGCRAVVQIASSLLPWFCWRMSG